jgi:hypothetical protein
MQWVPSFLYWSTRWRKPWADIKILRHGHCWDHVLIIKTTDIFSSLREGPTYDKKRYSGYKENVNCLPVSSMNIYIFRVSNLIISTDLILGYIKMYTVTLCNSFHISEFFSNLSLHLERCVLKDRGFILIFSVPYFERYLYRKTVMDKLFFGGGGRETKSGGRLLWKR